MTSDLNRTQQERIALKRIVKLLKLEGYFDSKRVKYKYLVEKFCEVNSIFPDKTKKDWIYNFIYEQFNDPNSLIFRDKKLPVLKNTPTQVHKRAKRKERRNGLNIKNWRQRYNDYLASNKWKKFRDKLKADRGHKCEKCGVSESKNLRLDGHHVTYKRLFNELPEDILIVCRKCHEFIHNKSF